MAALSTSLRRKHSVMEEEDNIPKVPKVISVNPKVIFATAAKWLHLRVKQEHTFSIDEDTTYVRKIEIENIMSVCLMSEAFLDAFGAIVLAAPV